MTHFPVLQTVAAQEMPKAAGTCSPKIMGLLANLNNKAKQIKKGFAQEVAQKCIIKDKQKSRRNELIAKHKEVANEIEVEIVEVVSANQNPVKTLAEVFHQYRRDKLAIEIKQELKMEEGL